MPAETRSWPGAATSSIRIADPYSILDAPPTGLRRAVIRDGGWGRAALSAAELLAEQGVALTIVTAEFAVAESVAPTVRTPLYKHLLGHGARFLPAEEVVRLDGAAVVLRNVYSGRESRIEEVDLMVDWNGPRMVETLAEAARQSGAEIHVIGDCVSPRAIEIAIAEGALAARRL